MEAGWTRHGAVFPDIADSKSGAMLIRPAPPHYLLWGAGTIAMATSTNLVNWTVTNSSFMSARAHMFDSLLVEAGPPPLPLDSGDLLFLYNSADHGSAGFGAYHVGWVILDGHDPTVIKQRSSVPLMGPRFRWETGTCPAMFCHQKAVSSRANLRYRHCAC